MDERNERTGERAKFELLKFLDLSQPSPAVRFRLTSALQALHKGDLERAESNAVIALDIAMNSIPFDKSGCGLARMIVGLVAAEQGHDSWILESAAFNLRGVLDWPGRWNEAICVAAIATVELRRGNVGKAIALFHNAVDTLEKSRFYYGSKGMQSRLRVMDELSKQLRRAAECTMRLNKSGACGK